MSDEKLCVTASLEELTSVPETELEKQMEKLGEALISFHDSIKVAVADLPDEAFGPLVAEFHRQALPDATKNFAMPIYDEIADRVEAELGMRIAFRRAKVHMESTGSKWYCIHCDGDCTPEHLADRD